RAARRGHELCVRRRRPEDALHHRRRHPLQYPHPHAGTRRLADGPASMTVLFFKQALLKSGWAPNVRVELAGDVIASIETDTRAVVGDEQHAIGLPGMPNVHSHAFQRGMAGLAEIRGPSHDTFWTWRDTMYRFALALDPEDVQAVAGLAY